MTLGIIGIVAALTMPTLVSSYKKHVVETKLKRSFSAVNQALKLYEANECDAQDYITCYTGAGLTFYQFIEDLNSKYLNIKLAKNMRYMSVNNAYGLTFKDGTVLVMYSNREGYIYMDEKAINNRQTGRNYFRTLFGSKGFAPYNWCWNGTRDHLFSASCDGGVAYGCGKNGTGDNFCTLLIQYEGWKIPDDYPYQF